MGIIKLKERRVSPEIIAEPTPAAAADLDSSSKEESFQDSQAYLASDSEDDYYSVKGTPSSVASSRAGTPQRTRISIKNLYYHSMLERRRIHLIPPPITTRATTIGGMETAPPPLPRDQKPLIEFFTDPYWTEQISTDGDISGSGTHPTTTSKQMRLVEFLQDSFWKKEFFLTPSPKCSGKPAVSSSPGGAIVVAASLKSGSKRAQNYGSSKAADDDHDQRHGGCCFPSFAPRFWCKKRKTKVAA